MSTLKESLLVRLGWPSHNQQSHKTEQTTAKESKKATKLASTLFGASQHALDREKATLDMSAASRQPPQGTQETLPFDTHADTHDSSQTLTNEYLASLPESLRKQAIGNALYPKIKSLRPDHAGVLTGWLLTWREDTLLKVVNNWDTMKSKVVEHLEATADLDIPDDVCCFPAHPPVNYQLTSWTSMAHPLEDSCCLDDLPSYCHKNVLGEQIYLKIWAQHPSQAGQITRRILLLPTTDLRALLDKRPSFWKNTNWLEWPNRMPDDACNGNADSEGDNAHLGKVQDRAWLQEVVSAHGFSWRMTQAVCDTLMEPQQRESWGPCDAVKDTPHLLTEAIQACAQDLIKSHPRAYPLWVHPAMSQEEKIAQQLLGSHVTLSTSPPSAPPAARSPTLGSPCVVAVQQPRLLLRHLLLVDACKSDQETDSGAPKDARQAALVPGVVCGPRIMSAKAPVITPPDAAQYEHTDLLYDTPKKSPRVPAAPWAAAS